MFYKLKNDKRGMTLIEMVISLVILSILMTSTMGMITSSMSIFTSTSQAAIDRMVGNSVYGTLEKTLKYSTHLTISDTPLQRQSQAFYVLNTDPDTNSGKLQYRGKGDTNFLSLYADEFYRGRTLQYSVKEIGNDQKHVKIEVKIFREGKVVYTKEAILKCVNLSLIRSGSNANMIDDKSAADSLNQYLYFSVDELLIAGGDTAWSIEYKINEYMERYNAILAEYYGKLCLSENPLEDAINSHSDTEGNRIHYDELKSVIDGRQKAIFGDGTNTVAWEGDDYTKYNNLRQHYQDEILDLLKFAPTKTKYETNNPYYHVVATKEELYLGFMLTYYDKNNDGKISKDEYPSFTDSDTFFAGTTLDKYAGSNNGMYIMAYFKDFLDDDYSKLFGTTYSDVVYYNSIGIAHDPNANVRVFYNMKNNHVNVFGGDGYSYIDYSPEAWAKRGGPYVGFRTDSGNLLDPKRYSYDGGQTATEIGFWSEKSGLSGMEWDEAFRKITDNFNALGGSLPILNDEGSLALGTYSRETGIKIDGDGVTRYAFTASVDLPQGWYAFKETPSGGKNAQARFVVYLEASETARNFAQTQGGKPIAVKAGGKVVFHSYNYMSRYYYYDQAQYHESDGVDTGTEKVAIYTINKHEYKDWVLYGVDWNSWFKTSQDGLLNSVIGGIANWFTGQSNVNELSGANADLALGLVGKYNVNNVNWNLHSYNLAWMVYSPKRGTWYYLPDSSNRVNSAFSGITWVSNKNTPVPLDVKGWSSSNAMVKDIETRKLSSSGFFGLIDTTSDRIWVPLPTGGAIDRTEVIK